MVPPIGPGPVRRPGHRSLVGPISIKTPDRCPDIQIDVSVTCLQHLFQNMTWSAGPDPYTYIDPPSYKGGSLWRGL